MIIRHGEKPSPEQPDAGVDPAGNPDPHSLTPKGWDRARALATLFTSAQRPGLSRPDHIYASGGSGGEGTRPRETVQPLTTELGVPADTSFAKGDEEQLAEQVLSEGGTTLISWQHEEIPAIVAALGPVTPTPPTAWPDDRYDVVWTFTATDHGWKFAQVPELLLPGDSRAPIAP
jgi:hypothetical protein